MSIVYFSIINGVAGYIGHKPVPKLGQCPAKSNAEVDRRRSDGLAYVLLCSDVQIGKMLIFIHRLDQVIYFRTKPVLPCVDVEIGEMLIYI